MALSPKGIVYVGTMGANVYAVADRNHDGVAEEVHTIASGLSTPNGVAWRTARSTWPRSRRVLRFDGIDDRLANPPKPVVVSDAFPQRPAPRLEVHPLRPGRQALRAGGAPCNVCEQDNPIYGTITRMSPTAASRRSSRAASATRSASTGTRRRTSSGSPTTGATCWATTCRPTS